MNRGKIKKIILIVLSIFVVLTALYFWVERAIIFFDTEEISSAPCFMNDGIATIELKGEIVPYIIANDEENIDTVYSEDILYCINRAKLNKKVKSVILEINSYGGSPVASEEIMNEIKTLDKPIVAVIRESAISGAYLVATATDRIFASEISDIGGIGVTMSYLDYSQRNEQDGITYQEISSGKFKDAGDPNKLLTQEEYDLFMRDNTIMHEAFVKNVATNKKLDIEKVRKLADGSSMLGVSAKENGLIDEIGNAKSAEDWLNKNSK